MKNVIKSVNLTLKLNPQLVFRYVTRTIIFYSNYLNKLENLVHASFISKKLLVQDLIGYQTLLEKAQLYIRLTM